ncbi:unnamed protein product [Meloidogyne enterolobii]|uniref:Uncharacterized protein n=1 Tax=Meloidogyne enterolobii TaxID=390850 RepID=A0ACB1AB43_MELEN
MDNLPNLQVIEHSEKILNNYEKQIKEKYISTDKETQLLFINKRINAYKRIVDEDDYVRFIENHGLDMNEFDGQQDVNNIPGSLRNIR